MNNREYGELLITGEVNNALKIAYSFLCCGAIDDPEIYFSEDKSNIDTMAELMNRRGELIRVDIANIPSFENFCKHYDNNMKKIICYGSIGESIADYIMISLMPGMKVKKNRRNIVANIDIPEGNREEAIKDKFECVMKFVDMIQ